MKRAGILARLSTEDQGDSLDSQVEVCTRWAEGQGYEVLPHHVWREDDVSGALTPSKRPILMTALGALKNEQVDVLVARDLDRLGRMLSTAELVEQYQEYGGGIRFVNLPASNDPIASMMMLGQAAVFATIERMQIVERTTAGRRRKLTRGGYAGGAVPHWLTWTGETWELNGGVERIRTLIARYLNGEGATTLANDLYGDGSSNTAVLAILRNPALVGRLYNRLPTAARGNRLTRQQRNQVMKVIAHAGSLDEADAIAQENGLVRTEVPAITDWATYARIQRKRVASWHAPLRDNSRWLLQGRIRCGKCGRVYLCRPGKKGRRYYKDSGRIARSLHGAPRCDGRTLVADEVEEQVRLIIEDALADQSLLKVAAGRYLAELDERITSLGGDKVSEVATLREKRERLALLWASGDISNKRWETERNTVDRKLAQLATQFDGRASLQALLDQAEDVRRGLEADLPVLVGDGGYLLPVTGPRPRKGNLVAVASSLADLAVLLDVRLTVLPKTVRVEAVVPLGSVESSARGKPLKR